jgi:hypothetical protein
VNAAPEIEETRAEKGERFRAHVERLMEERGIESLEELHERFVGTEYAHVPVPGLHEGKPVSFGLFERLTRRESPYIYGELLSGLREVFGLTGEEFLELMWLYVWGEPRPRELHEA